MATTKIPTVVTKTCSLAPFLVRSKQIAAASDISVNFNRFYVLLLVPDVVLTWQLVLVHSKKRPQQFQTPPKVKPSITQNSDRFLQMFQFDHRVQNVFNISAASRRLPAAGPAGVLQNLVPSEQVMWRKSSVGDYSS